jgi:hypothetical protein
MMEHLTKLIADKLTAGQVRVSALYLHHPLIPPSLVGLAAGLGITATARSRDGSSRQAAATTAAAAASTAS